VGETVVVVLKSEEVQDVEGKTDERVMGSKVGLGVAMVCIVEGERSEEVVEVHVVDKEDDDGLTRP
jgi:hypothetical protein